MTAEISELVVWGSLVAGGGSICAVASFWMKLGADRAKIENLERRADENETRANEAHEKISIAAAAHGMFREQVAREYASQQMIKDIEDRLSRGMEHFARVSAEAMNALRESHSEGLTAVHKRLDDLLKELLTQRGHN